LGLLQLQEERRSRFNSGPRVVVGLIVGITFIRISHPVPTAPKPQIETKLIDPDDYSPKPAKAQAGGGGGGGDRDLLQASVGRLRSPLCSKLAPPAAVIRNPSPKIGGRTYRHRAARYRDDYEWFAKPWRPQISATIHRMDRERSAVLVPAQVVVSDRGTGAALARATRQVRAAMFSAWARVTPPRVIYQIDPEFSEEARKVKFQGNCVLGLIVDATDGHKHPRS